MDLTELSSHALHVLRAQGWDGSEQNIESDLADLKEEGFDTPPSYVISILKKYSGLEFEAISKYTQSRLEISFGLDKALEIPCVKKNLIEHEIILGKNFIQLVQ
jgi:SMC interacting uncharacterized protein involved in chromosome segregation